MNLFNSNGNNNSAIQFFSVSSDFGSTGLKGAQSAPEIIRLLSQFSGKSEEYKDIETDQYLFKTQDINDLGNLKHDPTKNTETFLNAIEIVSKSALTSGKLLALGGDHLISLPIIRSALNLFKNLQVIHFDAHFDLAEVHTNTIPAHNNFVSYLINNDSLKKWIFLGQRGITKNKTERNSKSIRTTIDSLVSFLDKNDPIYITIDMDVFNHIEFSAVSYPVPGRGLYIEEALSSIRLLKENGFNIIGLDICEYNPKLDSETYICGRQVVDFMARIISILRGNI